MKPVPTKSQINQRLHTIASRVLARRGYQLTGLSSPDECSNPLEIALKVMIAMQPRVSIVQVGANDGKFNDPIYPVAMKYSDRIDLLLIEPQEDLHTQLRRHYSAHPSVSIVPCAIGEIGQLDLYSIRREYWSECDPVYAQGWPDYRAPLGVTSTHPEHVTEWLAQNYRGSRRLEDGIERRSVTCSPLADVLSEYDWKKMDVLIVDTEGHDDVVLHHSSLGEFTPSIVWFEAKHLQPRRLAAVLRHLGDLGYESEGVRGDILAIRVGR